VPVIKGHHLQDNENSSTVRCWQSFLISCWSNRRKTVRCSLVHLNISLIQASLNLYKISDIPLTFLSYPAFPKVSKTSSHRDWNNQFCPYRADASSGSLSVQSPTCPVLDSGRRLLACHVSAPGTGGWWWGRPPAWSGSAPARPAYWTDVRLLCTTADTAPVTQLSLTSWIQPKLK